MVDDVSRENTCIQYILTQNKSADFNRIQGNSLKQLYIGFKIKYQIPCQVKNIENSF